MPIIPDYNKPTAVRPATEEEGATLSTGRVETVSSRERLFADYGRPWFVEEISALQAHERMAA